MSAEGPVLVISETEGWLESKIGGLITEYYTV